MGALTSDLQTALCQYATALQSLSACGLIGAYVHGSVAAGCFNPSTSDVDVVIVGACLSDVECITSVELLHQRIDLPIDATFVSPDQLHIERIPTPIGYQIKPFSNGKAICGQQGRRDFVIQSQEVYERGLRLFGPPAIDLFQPVPWPLIREYINWLLPFIPSHFKNPVLMLCRCAYTWIHQQMCSKKEAGEWALAEKGPEWHSLIDTALRDYTGNGSDRSVDKNTVFKFHKHVQECIGEHA